MDPKVILARSRHQISQRNGVPKRAFLDENNLFIDTNVNIAEFEDGLGLVEFVGHRNEDDVVLSRLFRHQVLEGETDVGGEAGVEALARDGVKLGGAQVARAPLVRRQIGDVLARARRQMMRLRTGNGAVHDFQRLVQFVPDDGMRKSRFRNDAFPAEIPGNAEIMRER